MSERPGNEAVVDRALDELRRAGVADGEVFLRDSLSTSVDVHDGILENVLARGERGMSVRILEEGRVGFAYTSDLTESGIGEVVALARANARVTSPDDALALANEPPPAADLGIVDPSFAARPIEEKTAVAFAIERAARAAEPRVSAFRKTSYGDGAVTTLFATTAGARGSYQETSFGGGTACMATDGPDKQIGYFGEGGRTFGDVDATYVGEQAARRAAEKLGARPFKTQRLDLLLEPYIAMGLLGAIASLFSAENVLKGKSLLRDRVGQAVASDLITIRDSGRLVGGKRSAPFDGEGVPTRDVTLVEGGVLRGYLHSIKTANRMGAERTGSARRGGYNGSPHVSVSNFALQPGDRSPDDIARSADRALAITSLLNLHTIDPISGDFSLGATGTYMERGERQYPVRGIAIAGNLLTLLGQIAAVGNDLRYGPSGIGSSTLLVGDISVSGA